ncbi:MAG: Fic family protein [Candidatus Aenigmarchaeota archaeon]|nr:Fic family protein [Candidatus Aenigmarchaeota archaeon]
MNQELYEKLVKKKKELDKLRPFPKAALHELKRQLEIELTYNSNAIEGNSLTLQETRLVLEHGITIRGKSLKDHFEAINHKEAILFVEDSLKEEIDESLIKKLNGLVLDKIYEDERGRYRTTNVRILGAIKSPPQAEKVPRLMDNFIEYITKNPDNMNTIEMAAIMHYKFVEIHPFSDGNGRIARLLMNLFLMKHGYPITIVLKNDRKKYYQTLKDADKGDIKPFIDFIGYCINRSLDIYLSAFKKGMEYISIKEAAKGTAYTQEYLSLLARKGRLDAIKLGRNWVVAKKTVENYIKSVKEKKAK